MEIKVIRFTSDEDTTISTISIDGVFECFGLEDEYRDEKIVGKTRIPAGVYRIKLRTMGGFHNRYGKKFPGIHKGMLEIVEVPGFSYILIHVGNTNEDTDGCLLTGQGAITTKDSMSVLNSVLAYKELYCKVIESAINGSLTIEYIDSDMGAQPTLWPTGY